MQLDVFRLVVVRHECGTNTRLVEMHFPREPRTFDGTHAARVFDDLLWKLGVAGEVHHRIAANKLGKHEHANTVAFCFRTVVRNEVLHRFIDFIDRATEQRIVETLCHRDLVLFSAGNGY